MSGDNHSWKIVVRRKAKRVLTRLPSSLKLRLEKAIDELAYDPRPAHSKQLKGTKDLYRIRVGSWRVIYAIKEEQLLILIVTVAPRGQVYKNV